MSTRRSFLQSALFLPSAFAAPALAQDGVISAELAIENIYTFHPQLRGKVAAPLYQPKPVFEFSVGEPGFNRLINVVVREIASRDLSVEPLRLRPETGFASTDLSKFANFLKARVTVALSSETSYASLLGWEKDWLLAEGICEWVKRNLRYDYDLVKREEESGSEKESIARTDTKLLLAMPQPAGQCWHMATSTRDLARAAGLKCYLANGHYRELGEVAPPIDKRNHSVNVFLFDGKEVPADVTGTVCRFHQKNSMIDRVSDRKVCSQFVLPRDTTAWSFFLSRFNSEVNLTPKQTISDDVQNVRLKCTYTYSQWASLNTAPTKQMDLEFIEWEKVGRKK